VRTKETEHQAQIADRSFRLKNIRGVFEARNCEEIKNRNIILIDDVITTGATLSEAKKVLERAGARSVIAFTIAH
jgi:competence protein ComFC